MAKTRNQPKVEFEPGEYEVLTTKAEFGWWDSGHLLITNHRLVWTPGRFTSAPRFEIDLQKVKSVTRIKSIRYLFMQPSLRLTLKDGSVYELHNMANLSDVQRAILENLQRERYEPGSLFKD